MRWRTTVTTERALAAELRLALEVAAWQPGRKVRLWYRGADSVRR